jgi:hypothetical protein
LPRNQQLLNHCRKTAADRLSRLETSSLEIVHALLDAWKNETQPRVKRFLRRALTAAPHYQILAIQAVPLQYEQRKKDHAIRYIEEEVQDLLIK